eukprot:gene9073-10041_t
MVQEAVMLEARPVLNALAAVKLVTNIAAVAWSNAFMSLYLLIVT